MSLVFIHLYLFPATTDTLCWPGYLGMLVQILINHIGIKYKVIIERIEWNLVAQMQYN